LFSMPPHHRRHPPDVNTNTTFATANRVSAGQAAANPKLFVR